MASLLPNGKQQYTDPVSGLPLAYGTLTTYAAGTLTPKLTWADANETTANPATIVLDANGLASVFWDGVYDVVVQSRTGQLVYTQSKISSSLSAVDLASASGGSSLIGFLQRGANAVLRFLNTKLYERVSFADFGAVGDGTTDDTAAIAACFAATTSSNTILAMGTVGNRFVTGSQAVPAGVHVVGPSADFYATDTYDASAFTSAPALLLKAGATWTMGNTSGLQNLGVFPFGMTFPQPSGAAYAGTAITINRGTGINTVNVALRRLLIVGFGQAVSAYCAPRLVCEHVNFDCTAGIVVNTAGDPIYIEDCHGWPYGTIATPIPTGTTTDAGLRDRRSGAAYSFINQADAAKIRGCFAFGYMIGFSQQDVNGIEYFQCGSDDYNLVSPLASTGWNIAGQCGYTELIGCQSVAHLHGITMNLSSDVDTVKVIGGLIGANSADGVHVLTGSLVATGISFGAQQRAVGLYGATNRLAFDGNVIQGTTNEIVLNNASSPNVFIGRDNITTDVDFTQVPMYRGNAVSLQIPAANNTYLPLSGDHIDVTGSTAINFFFGGYPGRGLTLHFPDGTTINKSAITDLTANLTLPAGSALTLNFRGDNQCYQAAPQSND